MGPARRFFGAGGTTILTLCSGCPADFSLSNRTISLRTSSSRHPFSISREPATIAPHTTAPAEGAQCRCNHVPALRDEQPEARVSSRRKRGSRHRGPVVMGRTCLDLGRRSASDRCARAKMRLVSPFPSRMRPSSKCSVSIDTLPSWLASYRAKKSTRRARSVYRSNMVAPLSPPYGSRRRAQGTGLIADQSSVVGLQSSGRAIDRKLQTPTRRHGAARLPASARDRTPPRGVDCASQ